VGDTHGPIVLPALAGGDGGGRLRAIVCSMIGLAGRSPSAIGSAVLEKAAGSLAPPAFRRRAGRWGARPLWTTRTVALAGQRIGSCSSVSVRTRRARGPEGTRIGFSAPPALE